MQAVILAGGQGTRLKPYTSVLPKPLMPLVDKPVLEIVIRQLSRFGFRKIVICVGHLASLIQTFCGDGSRWNVEIRYSVEDKPLGTSGPLSLIGDLEPNVLVMNGDILTDMDFGHFMRFHIERKGIATLAYCQKDITVTLGVVEDDADHRIVSYKEKPVISYKASMGVYCLQKAALSYLPRNQRKDLPELVADLIKAGYPIAGYPFRGTWLDIGRMDDYEQAAVEYEQSPGKYLPD